MSSVFKSYMSITLIVVALLVFVGIVSVTVDVQNARNYHSSVVNVIENSNHAAKVIEACKEEATENGYELTVTSYDNSPDGISSSKISKVVLTYDYTIGILNVSSEKEIVGYAR